MSKRDEFNHERFEELCALVALGQISAGEYAELRSHLTACEDCRRSRQDFLEILHEHLPLVAGGEPAGASSKVAFHDSSYRQRFLQRAEDRSGTQATSRKTGFTIESGVGTGRWYRSTGMARYVLPVAAGLLVAALGLNGFQWYRGGERLSSATGRVSQLREEISQLNRQISDQSLAGLSVVPAIPEIPEKPEAETDRLVLELAQAQGERRMALAELQSQSRKLVETQADTDALNRALEEARNSEVRLSEKLAGVERVLQTRTSELESLRKQGGTHEVTLAIQEKQIGELARKVNEQAETIQRDRELLAVGREMRDFMTDPKFRVADVREIDGSGEIEFLGRAFYAEGKRLVIYTHGMPKDIDSMDNFSLQAWGQRGTTLTGSAKSLGILFADRNNENRWILEYDDPEILAQIDSVFVTLEPKEGSLKPLGRELMYSYLKAGLGQD